MCLWWSNKKLINWSSRLSGDEALISRDREAAIHWVSPLQCVNSTVNHYEYQSSVTLHSNESHLARMKSLPASNIPLIVRCFQGRCQVNKRPFSMMQPRRTHTEARVQDRHALCTNMCHHNQYLILLTSIRTQPKRLLVIGSCIRGLQQIDLFSSAYCFNCLSTQIHG